VTAGHVSLSSFPTKVNAPMSHTKVTVDLNKEQVSVTTVSGKSAHLDDEVADEDLD
jgi:hypothetical protein